MIRINPQKMDDLSVAHHLCRERLRGFVDRAKPGLRIEFL